MLKFVKQIANRGNQMPFAGETSRNRIAIVIPEITTRQSRAGIHRRKKREIRKKNEMPAQK
ncbi:hypothetical protein SDC9_142176 [bioreactor metagenome]|uniref:Uncharacterized protein n=1 Tax=bioreactor metagenome TaxID=1076179 RepID=A0A645E0E7_9ZZZZ